MFQESLRALNLTKIKFRTANKCFRFCLQVSALKTKMADPEMSFEAREKYAIIAEKAVNMTESIKHSIVLYTDRL